MKRQALGLSGNNGGLLPKPRRLGEPSPSGSRQMSPGLKDTWASPLPLVTRMSQGCILHSQASTSAEGGIQLWSRLHSLMPARPVISSGLLNKHRKEAVVTGPSPECQHPEELSYLRHVGHCQTGFGHWLSAYPGEKR